MNKKLIAAAVSAAVMAPVASHAESSFYGKIGNVYKIDGFKPSVDDPATVKDERKSTTDLSTLGSRFGFRNNTDIGNGLSVHGTLEFAIKTDREVSTNTAGTDEHGGVDDVRVGSVGLAGPFGRIDAGNQWSAYFNTFGTLISPTYSLGAYIYSSAGGGAYRASNTIKYSNNFGPLHLEFDVRLNESNEGSGVAEGIRGEGMGLGLSLAVSDALTIAVASDTEEGAPATVGTPLIPAVGTTPAVPAVAGTVEGPATDRFGISGKLNMANGMSVRVGFQNVETAVDKRTGDPATELDSQFIFLSGSISDNTSWLLGVSEADDGTSAASESDQNIWGIYHSVGGGLTLLYEASDIDFEPSNKDGTIHLVGMRVNF